MDFKLQKDKFIQSKTYVWCDGFCIGFFRSEAKVNDDIDWEKYKKDKTLKMSFEERYNITYTSFCYPNISCGHASSLEGAVTLIHKKQNELYNLLEKENNIFIEDL